MRANLLLKMGVLAMSGASAACAPTPTSEAVTETTVASAPEPNSTSTTNIFIARRVGTGGPPPAALFGGRFEVADGCLLFRTSAEVLLPVFLQSASISASENSLVIGDRRIEIGSAIEIGGGERAISANDLVLNAPPACNLKRLYIGS
ncbi:hypothetical protein [Erythrobacter donghaensis]|jgi:hypothetical protein|uniref:hypothetical protein n=1 Tax=Erythrobacter donghaensis TaxID=267135 RepID=UPI00093DAD40|nr:hypothetical protein [Erythrobacter donghaensis]